MKTVTLFSACAMVALGTACSSPKVEEAPELKPRLVVMTDICPADLEPDDMESAVRLMAYADQFEIEAIMTTVGWNCDPYPDEWIQYLYQVVDAYSQDVENLKKRSQQEGFLPIDQENGQQYIGYWPSAEYLRSRCMAGSHRAGIGVIGPDNNTVGSDFLIQLADEEDPRPIWVCAWGSGNTLAQAIWKVQQTRTPKQLKQFLHKFRIYTITDQDMVWAMRENRAYSAHRWLRQNFADDLEFIWDEGTWQRQCELGKEHWTEIQQQIQGKGALGKIYPNYKYGVEGDTPSFLYAMPNGLHNPEDPMQSCWAGCHQFGVCPDSLTLAWTSWNDTIQPLTVAVKNYFYPAELNDFCARMLWAAEGTGNTNPVVRVNGQRSLSPICLEVQAGQLLKLDASATTDAEGDSLSFHWQQDAFGTSIDQQDCGTTPVLALSTSPSDAGRTFHYILSVTDHGQIPLTSYARVIVKVE